MGTVHLFAILFQGRKASTGTRRGARVIAMRRRNLVKLAVSSLNAMRLYEKTGAWNLVREEDRLGPLRVEPAAFSRTLERKRREEEDLACYVDSLPLPTLWLEYSEWLQDGEAAGRVLKNTPDDLREALENFGEARAPFAGTAWEWMFDEKIDGV